MKVVRAGLFAALLVSSTAMADTINGTASVAIGQVGVSALGTDFFSYDSTPGRNHGQCDVPNPVGQQVPGCFAVVAATGNFFYPDLNPQDNGIQDLLLPLPLSGNILIPQFIYFDGGAALGGVTMDLTQVLPGGGTDCSTLSAGQLAAANTSCTIFVNGVASPYLLTNSSDGSVLYIGATMYFQAYTGAAGAAGGETPYEGVFTTQLSNNILNVFTAIAVDGQTVTSPWTATFTPEEVPTAAPEPASILLTGLGLLGVGYRVRRKRTS
jgi:hypothetical protein